MQILVVIESNSWADYHLSGSLEDMGHEVHRYFYGDSIGEFYGRQRQSERVEKNTVLLKKAKELHKECGLDFIFCYVYDDFLLPETASALACLDVPMVNLNVDMVNQWYRQLRTAKYFTRILCAQRDNMENMSRYGAKVSYFPMAGRPGESSESSKLDFEPHAPVTFLGTPMLYRNKVLSKLIDEGTDIAIYGKFWKEERMAAADRNLEKTVTDIWHYGWPRLRCEGGNGLIEPLKSRFKRSNTEHTVTIPPDYIHGVLTAEDLPVLFKKSKINLGFTRMVGDDPDIHGKNQVKLRDFEVPLAGGFYLVEEAPEYAELFIPGKEVETWSSPAELVDKIEYFINHDSERVTIAQAGHERALKYHTWAERFTSLFKDLKLEY